MNLHSLERLVRACSSSGRRRTLLWRVMLCASLTSASGAAWAGSYQVVDLGGTQNGAVPQAYGLNHHGTAVGQATAQDAPHLLHPIKAFPSGRSVDLAVRSGMAGVRGSAVAINNSGQTTGWIEPTLGAMPVVFIEQQGTMRLLPSPSGNFPTVRGMNNLGDVVGNVYVVDAACVGNCAFLIHDGRWTILPALPHGELSYAYSINDAGLIVGESFQGVDSPVPIKAVQWRGGHIQVLKGMEQIFASAHSVNQRGEVVGELRLSDGVTQHAFRWHRGELTDLDGRADSISNAWAVNASGQTIGERHIAPRNGYFVTVGAEMQWLDDQLLPGAAGPWTLGGVRAINGAGQIVGTAKDAQGHWHAVRLDPVAP